MNTETTGERSMDGLMAIMQPFNAFPKDTNIPFFWEFVGHSYARLKPMKLGWEPELFNHVRHLYPHWTIIPYFDRTTEHPVAMIFDTRYFCPDMYRVRYYEYTCLMCGTQHQTTEEKMPMSSYICGECVTKYW